MNQIQKTALINSSITALYVIGVSLFMYWGGSHKIGQGNTVLIPIGMLMLFVFSASFTAYFMLGKPLLTLLDGKRKEALSLVGYTLGFFFLFTLVGLTLLILASK